MNMTFRKLVALLAVVLLPLAAQADETTTYYVNDLIGSPMAAMDAQGNVLWTETYAPYGARLEAAPANPGNPSYTGKPEDPVTGLVYMGARWYDPETARFASVDPVRFTDSNVHSFNRYAYANNSPYVFVDPDGRNAEALFTELTPAIGRLYAAHVAFAVGVATGDPYLMAAATDGMRDNAGEAAWAVTDTINPVVGAGKIRRSVGMTEQVADKFSRSPKSLMDQMVLEAAQQGKGKNITDRMSGGKLKDPQFEGMEKWSYGETSNNGLRSEVHYVRDPETGALMDFKFAHHAETGE